MHTEDWPQKTPLRVVPQDLALFLSPCVFSSARTIDVYGEMELQIYFRLSDGLGQI